MPQFKRPSRPMTAGGFEKPAEPVKQPSAPLEKKGIDEELKINDMHLNEELMGQPLLMRKYTQELSKIHKKVKSIKNKLELREAQLTTLMSNDGKGRKVAEVEALVVQDEEVQKLRIELYDMEEVENEYEGIVRSIAQRLETLKEVSMNVRKELT